MDIDIDEIDIEELKRELKRISIPYSKALFTPVTEAERDEAQAKSTEQSRKAAEEQMRLLEENENKKKQAAAAAARAEKAAAAIARAEEAAERERERAVAEEEAAAAAEEAAARVAKGEHEIETTKIEKLEELREDKKFKTEIKSKDFNDAFEKALKIFENYIETFKSSKDKDLFDIVILSDDENFYIPKTDIKLYTDSDIDYQDNTCDKNLILSCIEYIHFMMGHLLYGDKDTKYVGDTIGTLGGLEFRKEGVTKNLIEHIKKNGSSLIGFLKFLEIREYYSMEKDSIISTFNATETLS